MTVAAHAYRILVERVAVDTDAEIRKGLERALGKSLPSRREDLYAALGGHDFIVQHDNAGNETYFVDGAAFLHLGPPQVGGEGALVTVTRKVTHYEVLR